MKTVASGGSNFLLNKRFASVKIMEVLFPYFAASFIKSLK